MKCSAKNKRIFISFFIIAFLTMNAFFPKGLIASINTTSLDVLLKSQTTLLYYSSFAIAPLKIVEKLISRINTNRLGNKTSKSDKPNKKETNTASQFFTLNGVENIKSGTSYKNSNNKNHLGTSFTEKIPFVSFFSGHGMACMNFPSAGSFAIFLFILVSIVLLPRGSLDEYIASNKNRV
ncbi:hypothetical protein ACFL58_00520 [Elusimicrobiota bacterium]